MINKNRWGIRIFSFAIVLIGVIIWLNSNYSQLFLSTKFINSAGTICSILVLIAGNLSYSRVHNLKVFLLGYLGGFTGLSLFFPWTATSFNAPVQVPDGFFGAVLLLIFVNLIIVLTVKTFVKYQIARSITLALFTVEIILIDIGFLSDHATSWVKYIDFKGVFDFPYWIGPVCALCVFMISVKFLKKDFHIGGLLTGIAVVNAVVWTMGIGSQSPDNMQVVMILAMELVTLTGIMLHWFSRMENRVMIDPLLQIYNRDYCGKIISEQAPLNMSLPFTVAMIDIDYFKNVNDKYGHKAGDDVLFAVAQAVNRTAVPEEGIACRYGGEELSVFFPGKTSKTVVKIMEKLREDIEMMVTESGNKKISVTISCGIAERADSSQSIQDALSLADKALYRAKKGGRNLVKSGKN